ncbi:permease [Flavobacteriaceae bacterium 14752]|uniref:permease n=1 Tax=Mesohalobacter salilacus TaxID=2491711 RepID=UPI000F643D57|nr:heavy metal-associated domain-containing protein [Flavobacteriaceae bacterium 14752]
MQYVEKFFQTLWELTLEMSPYLLLGFLIAGLLNGVFSKAWLERQLGQRGWASSIKAALFGVPLPLCSCGVIPTGVSLYKKGASKGATTSFLISTPQTGIDSILVTYALMGWAYAIVRPIIAFITGVFGGFFVDNFDKVDDDIKDAESCSDCAVESSKQHWFDRIFKYAFVTFLQDISRWLIIGLVLASIISMLVPEQFFEQGILSEPILAMLIVLLASVPLYVCATASVPIAAVLLMKGISPGAAIVFLMAGPATNIATFTVIWNAIGKRMTLIYLASIIGGALFFGIIIDYVLPASWLKYFSVTEVVSQNHHLLPHWLGFGSAVILTLLILNAEIRKLIPKKSKPMKDTNSPQNTYNIKGMTCNHCVANVNKHLSEANQVDDVDVDLSSGSVTIQGNISDDQVKAIVEDIGYEYAGKV